MNICFSIVRVTLTVTSFFIDTCLFVTFYTAHTQHAYNMFGLADRRTTEEVPKNFQTGFKQNR